MKLAFVLAAFAAAAAPAACSDPGFDSDPTMSDPASGVFQGPDQDPDLVTGFPVHPSRPPADVDAAPADVDAAPAEVDAAPPDAELPPNLCCCGNGAVEPGEQCDDGNHVDGDGCDYACQLEP